MIWGIVHKFCYDGTASAWILKNKFPNINLIYTDYEHQWKKHIPNFEKEDSVYFADYCPTPSDLDMLLLVCQDIHVYDHHATAVSKYENCSEQIKSHCCFDMEKCGASLTWSKLFPNKSLPLLISYIECMDLWKWERMPESRSLAEYISFKVIMNEPETITSLMNNLNNDTIEEYIKLGETLLEKKFKNCETVCRNARYLNMAGEQILTVNQTSIYSSETGHMLAEKSSNGLGATYHILPNNEVKFSIRGTNGNGARILAEKFGGGGHDLASGFQISFKKFSKILEESHV